MRGVLIVAVVAVGLAGCLDEAPPAASDAIEETAQIRFPQTAAWRELTDGPQGRNEVCAANVGPLFYAIGGYYNVREESLPGPAGAVPASVPENAVDIYNAETDTWTVGPDYPNNLDHCMAMGYDGWIYVFHSGGNQKLDPAKNEWVPIAPWPNSHNYGGLGVIDGKFYMSGGGSEAVDAYDPKADKWETVGTEMPTARGHSSGAVVNGKLYVVGGDIGGHAVNTDANEEFDPATGLWTKRAPLPEMRGSLWAVEWHGRLLVMGGQNGGANVPSFDNVDVYDPATDSWSALPPMNNPRHGFGGGVWNGGLYVFLGAPQQGVSAGPHADVLEPVWE